MRRPSWCCGGRLWSTSSTGRGMQSEVSGLCGGYSGLTFLQISRFSPCSIATCLEHVLWRNHRRSFSLELMKTCNNWHRQLRARPAEGIECGNTTTVLSERISTFTGSTRPDLNHVSLSNRGSATSDSLPAFEIVPNPITFSRVLTGTGQLEGGLETTIQNNADEVRRVRYVEVLPWWIQPWMHEMQVEENGRPAGKRDCASIRPGLTLARSIHTRTDVYTRHRQRTRDDDIARVGNTARSDPSNSSALQQGIHPVYRASPRRIPGIRPPARYSLSVRPRRSPARAVLGCTKTANVQLQVAVGLGDAGFQHALQRDYHDIDVDGIVLWERVQRDYKEIWSYRGCGG